MVRFLDDIVTEDFFVDDLVSLFQWNRQHHTSPSIFGTILLFSWSQWPPLLCNSSFAIRGDRSKGFTVGSLSISYPDNLGVLEVYESVLIALIWRVFSPSSPVPWHGAALSRNKFQSHLLGFVVPLVRSGGLLFLWIDSKVFVLEVLKSWYSLSDKVPFPLVNFIRNGVILECLRLSL